MKKKTTKKLAAWLLAFALVFTAAGCGSGGEQGAAAGAADASDTVGSGADVSMNLDTAEAEEETASAEKKQSKDFQFIDQWIAAIGDDSTELTLIIAHHLETSKSVVFSYEDVLLDGVSAENWEASGRGADTFTTEPESSFPQTLILNTNIDNYSELTIEATANFDDGTAPYPFSVTYQISELKRKIDESSTASNSSGLIYVKEQELYSKDGIVITIPEQTEDNHKLYARLENESDETLNGFTYGDVTVDGILLAQHNEAATIEIAPGDTCDIPITFFVLEGTLDEKMPTDVTAGEISFSFNQEVLTFSYTRND